MRRRYGNDLLVHAGIVFHQQDADRAHVDDATRDQCARVADQHVDGIAVTRQGVRDETVVSGVAHRRVKKTIDDEHARCLVRLVLDRLAANRHLDDGIHFIRWIAADRQMVKVHLASLSTGDIGAINWGAVGAGRTAVA